MAKAQFKKGDRVRFTVGMRPVEGRVKEDRGAIGVRSRRLYLIEFGGGDEPHAPSHIELPAEQLEAVLGAGTATS